MIKNITIVIICTIIIIVGLEIINITKNDWIKENEISFNATEEKSEKKEIIIYDIEDGYINVPYNEKAKKCEYDFEKYLNNTDNYYKYEDEKYKSKIGIDVSLYQQEIDWKKVKDSGVEFAILRLGFRGYGQEGKIVIDSKFEEYYRNAISEGIEIGVYFFSQAINIEEAKEEAEFVIENIKNKEIRYPVIFDLEKIKYDSARTDNLNVEEMTNITLEFCKEIKQNGYEPCIYGNAKTFTTKLELEKLNDYKKWYADYQKNPIYPYEFCMWQYTENGKVDGIQGNVDLNIFFTKKIE